MFDCLFPRTLIGGRRTSTHRNYTSLITKSLNVYLYADWQISKMYIDIRCKNCCATVKLNVVVRPILEIVIFYYLMVFIKIV